MKHIPIKILFLSVFPVACLIISNPWFANTAAAQGEKATPKSTVAAKPVTDDDVEQAPSKTAAAKTQEPTIDSQLIRFHMWDGTIINGKIQVDAISIKTKYGTLKIPVHEIKRFRPGLDSFPELNKDIASLVEKLGDKDFDVREAAHRSLAGMGITLRNEIDNFSDGGSAERKKRLAEISKEIDEIADEMDDDGLSIEAGLIRGDTIETRDFSVVGKILQEQFALTTKFGELTIRLNDIQMGDRSFQSAKDESQKTVTVSATAFFQRKPLSTRIRINKGDLIKIRASGTVAWTNWNTSSTPDGLTNQGQYMGIMSGTLTARIGTSGKLVKIGSNGQFVAKKNGVLYLAIAVQDNYAANTGYRWTGDYKAKIKVQPASK